MANTPEAARKYLEEALPKDSWEAASEALGRNHAYIQQYIRRGKPAWLREYDRALLVSIYRLNEDKLRPAPKPLPPPRIRRQGANKTQIDPQGDSKIVDEPRALELLRLWSLITDRADQDLVLRLAEALAAKAGLSKSDPEVA